MMYRDLYRMSGKETAFGWPKDRQAFLSFYQIK